MGPCPGALTHAQWDPCALKAVGLLSCDAWRVARDGLAPWWRSLLALPPLPASRRRRSPSSPRSSPSTLSTSPQSSSSTPSGRGRMAGAACPRRERCEGEAAPCPTLACGQAHLASHQALLAALDALLRLLVVVAACTTWLPAAVPHVSLAAVFSPRERRGHPPRRVRVAWAEAGTAAALSSDHLTVDTLL